MNIEVPEELRKMEELISEYRTINSNRRVLKSGRMEHTLLEINNKSGKNVNRGNE